MWHKIFLFKNQRVKSFTKFCWSKFSLLAIYFNWCEKKQSLYSISKRTRLPITLSILQKMCSLLRSGILDMFTSYMFETACTDAFFGFCAVVKSLFIVMIMFLRRCDLSLYFRYNNIKKIKNRPIQTWSAD